MMYGCVYLFIMCSRSLLQNILPTMRDLHVLSGVVVLSGDAPRGAALLFLRGAPRVIRRLVDPATIPHNFEEVWYMMQSDAVL